LNAYVADYLKEEVAAEGLVRNLPIYSEFLNMAGLADAEHVNYSTIARDCGVSSHTIKGYFQFSKTRCSAAVFLPPRGVPNAGLLRRRNFISATSESSIKWRGGAIFNPVPSSMGRRLRTGVP
jgi:hypothetical protein